MLSRGVGDNISAPLADDHDGFPVIDLILLPRTPVCVGGAQPQLILSAVQAPLLFSSSSLLRALVVKPYSNDSAATTISLLGSKNGIHDKGGGSKFRSLEEKIAQSDYDDNIGYFIQKKLHVWCPLPSGLWELGMIHMHDLEASPKLDGSSSKPMVKEVSSEEEANVSHIEIKITE
ncbi:hypothetical protein EV1_024981 [Malus domestica]